MNILPEALSALADYSQFVLWKLVDGKKLPINPSTLEVASSTDPTNWSSIENALAVANMTDGYGIGFVFTEADPFYFIDLDKCLTPDNQWNPVATTVMSMVPGAAIEVSQSGKGLHIIGKYTTIPTHSSKNIPLGIEFYHKERFVALTGNNMVGDAHTDSTLMLPGVINTYFSPKAVDESVNWTTKPNAEWSGIDDNIKLIDKALTSHSAASVFGDRASFNDLWNRNVDALAAAYSPDDSDTGGFDESSADAGLAQHLAFWTGNNCERMLTLMKMSGLVRDKWQREDYIRNTILRACSLQTEFHQTKRTKEPPRVSVEPTGGSVEIQYKEGWQFLGIQQQVEHFEGCVYVRDEHKVFTPSGSLLEAGRFNAVYGGYVFQLEADPKGKTTRKAWEAFTESQAIKYPQADTTSFRPLHPSGEIIFEEGRYFVNAYVEIETPLKEGDPNIFLNHIKLMIPDDRDRDIILSYMAAIIQHKGVKFHWCPLVQGVEGNGKSLLSEVVATAVGRRYSHSPKASDIDNKFNSWMYGSIFITLEDIFISNGNRHVMEALKPMITGEYQEVEFKGVDKLTKEICSNWMLNCNDDTTSKTADMRRIAPFYTMQQSAADLKRDGMDGDYFPRLWDWLRGKGTCEDLGANHGFAVVHNYLKNYQINPKFNPADKCHRAPDTTSTPSAIQAGLGSVEQEIQEAIEEGRTGFNNGWISSMALEKLLENMRMNRAIPRNKRRAMLQSLGYDWHPGLKDGRTRSLVITDGGKPRLFIKCDHISAQLRGGPNIIQAYVAAQTAAHQTEEEYIHENTGRV